MQPRIGVTAADGSVPQNYLNALRQLGAETVVLANDASQAAADVRRLDGIVLTGGADVAPGHFRERLHPKTKTAEPQRDTYELTLVKAAWECDLPVLAICRGVQVMNVALGGTLIQHVPDVVDGAVEHYSGDSLCDRHAVSIEPGTDLAAMLDAPRFPTNSTHHQALGQIAPQLRVNARAGDGIIEGVEAAVPRSFWIGVQWHPEKTFASGDAPSERLFRAFIRAIDNYKRLSAASSDSNFSAGTAGLK